jgi:hypothetical protein
MKEVMIKLMETKHLIIGLVIFIMIGLGIYYMGQLLVTMDTSVVVRDPKASNIGAVLEATDNARIKIDEAQQKRQEALESVMD